MTVRSFLKSALGRGNPLVLSAAGFTLLLAVVLFAGSLFSRPSSNVPDISIASQEETEDVMSRAARLLESGDATSAVLALRAHLVDNPDDAAAREMLQVALEQTPPTVTPPPSTPSGDDSQDDANSDMGYVDAVASIESLLPSELPGYRAGVPAVSSSDADKSFDPVEIETSRAVRRVLFSVHDRGSVENAQRFLTDVSEVVYPSEGEYLDVGVVRAYWGTDGEREATVAFVRGRYAFELVVGSVREVTPELKNLALSLAAYFEATR